MFVKAVSDQMKLEMDGVVRILSHSEAEQTPAFCETEVLDAMSLSKLVMKKGKPKPEEAVGILQRVCAIVAQAQDKGVIHCDLEPDNIMVRPDGRIVINNFGLAHLSAVQVKKGANAIGSPAFIAPEALLGNTVTTRSDTYSLGALLYYLISGKEPIEDATSLEGTMVAAQGAVVPLKRVCPTAPDALVSIVGRAMGVLPRLRFENARVFNEKLQKISTSRAESNYLRHAVAPVPQTQPVLVAAAASVPPPAPATQPLGAAAAQIRDEEEEDDDEQLWTKPPVLAALALVVLLTGLLSGILLGRSRDASRLEATPAVSAPVPPPPLVATRRPDQDKDSPLRKLLETAKIIQLGDAFVVLENDKVAVEWSATPTAPVIDLGRLSAHVSAFALGKLIDSGKVKSLSAPVYETFPEWEQGTKRLVTLRHILEHSTGLRAPAPDDAISPPSALQFALAAEMQSEPGTKHSFNARAFNLLSGIVAKTSDRQLDELFNAEVAAPLGLSSPSWTRDPKGMPLASSGIGWTAMDLAQLGVAFIDGGKTPAGRLFSEAWILAASTPSVADDNVSMLFRRHDVEGVGTLFYAADLRGSFWLIAPARKIVAVRLMRTETTDPAAQLPALVTALFGVKVDAKTLGLEQAKLGAKK
jgi:CubicO group peptidase (beta-lactamase class C family)